jgi:endonuclease/exonuclease/phosphatase family metal-dependent hydrolase
MSIGLCVVFGLYACASVDVPAGARNPESVIHLRVMTFNIEWGGAKVSFDNVVEAVRLSRADIVGIQEAEGNLQRLADELGWHYNLRNYVISKYPLIEPPGTNGKYVYVEVQPDRIVAIANVHLWSDPYGPDEIRDGATLEEVLEIERATRMAGIESYLSVLAPQVGKNIPLFLTGDFNAPSHLDWTEAAVGTRKHLRYAVPWPVSKAMTAAGFRDSWRVVYPDPVENPGLTWWAGRPPIAEYQPTENDGKDRIDFVWIAGPVSVHTSEIVGESDGPEVSFGVSPWPSDHRAVVSDFEVVPVDMPELVSTGQRVYRAGTNVDVVYKSLNGGVIYVANADSGAPVFKQPVNPGRSGWNLPAMLFEPGHYQVRMSSQTTEADVVKAFWVLAEDALPELELNKNSFAAGEGISVRWRNGPGNRHDYLAAYRLGSTTNYDNGLAWTYVDALPDGEKRLDASTVAWGWPLAPGDYVIRLIRDDGYDVLAESAPLTVESRVLVPVGTETFDDGRLPIDELFGNYQKLVDRGWHLDIIANSRPVGTSVALPIIALRSPKGGSAAWFLAGIHGEEPAGPNAIAATIDDLAALGDRYPVVLMPLLNPQGYARNWRYLNAPVYSESVDGQSVGDSSHMLTDLDNPSQSRAAISSMEADAITQYIMKTIETYPPRYSIDLHEDNLIDEGYVYSQGILGEADPLASEAVRILEQSDIPIKMEGQTRFDEDIVNGIIGPVTDSSIDELMSSKVVVADGRAISGPAAETVLVFETPAAKLTLARRVNAHAALIRRLAVQMGFSAVP